MQALNSYEQLCQSMTKLSEREQSRRRSLGNSTPTEPPDPTIPRLNVHIHSFSSTLSKSHRASLLSVVSLSQVQDITALSLPLYSCEIYNSAQYNFFPHASRKRIQVRPMSAIFSWTERSLVTRVASRLWRQNAKGMDISAPYDLMHNTHIGMHPESGKMMIWGDEVSSILVVRRAVG